MEQSPSWKANRFSVSQEIPRTLWNPDVQYRIHKYPPPVPILSQLDTVHTPTSHFLKVHLNIILPYMPGSPKWSISLRFLHQNPVYASPLPHTRYMTRLSHSSRFITQTILGEEYRSFRSSLWSKECRLKYITISLSCLCILPSERSSSVPFVIVCPAV